MKFAPEIKILITLIAFFLQLAISPSCTSATSDAWSDTVSQAALARAHGDSAQAEKLLRQALPLSSQPYMQYVTDLYLGDIYESRRMYSQAETEYANCEKLQHKYDYLSHGALQDHLAQMYHHMGKEKETETASLAAKQIEEIDLANVALVSYVKAIESSVKSRWSKLVPTDSVDKKRYLTTCNWLLDRKGRLNFIHVSRSSGDERIDKAAITALESMPPGPPVPLGKVDFVEVEFTFAYSTKVSK